MRGIKLVALLCTLALGAPAFSAGLTKTLPGDLTTAQAQAVVQASMKKAREIKVPMNIAVMDAGGNLKAFARMDDAFIGSIDIAQKKAKTARYFNMSTRDLGKASQPGGELYGIEVTNDGLVIFPGGVLLVDKNGVIVGSVGVGGGVGGVGGARGLRGLSGGDAHRHRLPGRPPPVSTRTRTFSRGARRRGRTLVLGIEGSGYDLEG